MDDKQILLLMAANIFSNQHIPAYEAPHLSYRRAIASARGLLDAHEKLITEEAQAKAKGAK
jgi:hypothetical protein